MIGTGADGALPVLQEVRDEARRRKVDLIVLPTAEAIGVLTGAAAHTNAILHLTCSARRLLGLARVCGVSPPHRRRRTPARATRAGV